MTPPLSLRLLGQFAVVAPPDVTVPTRKAEALLAYLAMPAGRSRPRTELATLLWGSRDERQARHSLNQAVSSLRKLLAPHVPGLLQIDQTGVALDPALVESDVDRLERALGDGSEAALARLGDGWGELLQGVEIREEAFEDWLAGERRRLRDAALAGLKRLLAARCAAGDHDGAVATAAWILSLDPLDEVVQRELMGLYARAGQRNAALRQYRGFADALRRELDTVPEAETRALYQQLLRDTGRPAPPPPEPRRPILTTATRPPEVVVGRFAAAATDPAAQAVADALREDLLTVLTRRRSLRVLSSDGLLGPISLADTALADPRDQGGRYVVEAAVRGAADVTVTARLMDAAEGSYLWSESCTGPAEGLLGPDAPLARRLAVSFVREIEVAEARKADGGDQAALDAWAHYHLALRELYRFSMPGLIAARHHLQRAVTLDPTLAAAHAHLAYVFVQMYWYGPRQARDECLDQGQVAAIQAVGLDPKDARGHFALGRLFAIRRQFDMAIPEFETAIGLDGAYAQGSFGLGQALAAAGRPESSVTFLDRAIELDPHDPHLWTFYHDRAEARFALGNLAEAAQNSKVAVRLPNASHFAWATLAAALGAAGERDSAGRALRQLRLLRPDYSLQQAREELAHHANRQFVGDYLAGLAQAGLPWQPTEDRDTQRPGPRLAAGF